MVLGSREESIALDVGRKALDRIPLMTALRKVDDPGDHVRSDGPGGA